MLTNNHKITHIMYDDVVEKHAKINGVSITEARKAILGMSFASYLKLLEASADIVPPSGQALSPTSAPASSTSSSSGKPTLSYAGKGTPIQQGMTVGLKGTGGLPTPGEITQVNQSNKTVMVRNPTTGAIEQHNNDDLQPFMAGAPGQQQQQPQQQPQMEEDRKNLARMRQLAGIGEDASGGASCAGGIATAAMPMGGVKRRQPVEEAPPKEYTPKGPPQTIIGDTKPGQAMGELSANLAARGKKTATRTNNGLRR